MTVDSDGKAYVAGWMIKMLAGAFLTAVIAWSSWATTAHFEAGKKIAVLESSYANMIAKLNSIESKLDRALQK